MIGFRVIKLWVAISIDPRDGDESVLMYQKGDRVMPLIAADEERLEQFVKPCAALIAKETGGPIRIVEFIMAGDIWRSGGE